MISVWNKWAPGYPDSQNCWRMPRFLKLVIRRITMCTYRCTVCTSIYGTDAHRFRRTTRFNDCHVLFLNYTRVMIWGHQGKTSKGHGHGLGEMASVKFEAWSGVTHKVYWHGMTLWNQKQLVVLFYLLNNVVCTLITQMVQLIFTVNMYR